MTKQDVYYVMLLDRLDTLGTKKPSTTRHEQVGRKNGKHKWVSFLSFRTIPLELAVRDVSYYSRPQTKNSVLQTRETAPGKVIQRYTGRGKNSVLTSKSMPTTLSTSEVGTPPQPAAISRRYSAIRPPVPASAWNSTNSSNISFRRFL